jgi:TolB-like protein/AraC-like DNA-binding protein/Tfp pilus assembly protein PilF
MPDLNISDQQFFGRLREIVEANLSNEKFDVEELAHEAHLSRSAIHRRLRSQGKTNASHFIREIRLQKAREMLLAGSSTVAEVAYKSGFGSPAYFSKCYHEYYGYPPGEERKRPVTNGNHKLLLTSGMAYIRKTVGRYSGLKRKLFVILPILAVAVVAFFVVIALNADRRPDDLAILVMPFKNLSGDPDNQYFADGIMEDILNNLNQVSDLRVISRTTAEHFRDTDLTSGEISRKVNARNLLEGSVRRQENRVRVTVQLIDGRKEQHLWSENYDRELTDMLGLQGEIARQVAGRLNALISDGRPGLKSELPTSHPEAWDNYLKARFLLNRSNDINRFDMSREGLMSSLKYYELAIAEDSSFAEAYAGLANAWYTLSAWGFYRPYRDGIEKAVKNFTKALELDPDCAEARSLKGTWLAYPECKFEESKSELETAIDLNPSYATAHQAYAQVLMITGPIELARKHVDIAVELEPYFWVVHNLSAWIYYFEEEYEKGIEACMAARDLNPDFIDNNWLFVLHYTRLGEGEKAAMALRDAFEKYPSLGHLGDEVMNAYYKSGIEGIFEWLIDVNKNRPIPLDGLTGNPFFISWWYSILGDREKALEWLEKTIGEKYVPRHYFNLITTNPDFDILRGDPRFTTVLEKSGLAAYSTRPPR